MKNGFIINFFVVFLCILDADGFIVHFEVPGLKDATIGYVPPSGKGCRYHTLGLQLSFRKSDEEVSNIVRSLREDNPVNWVRYWGQGTGFIINTLNLLPGDEGTIVERFKKIFS